MKTKTFKKKLYFNKETVSNLGKVGMDKLKAGRPTQTIGGCWLYETGEFGTCDCTYYCTAFTNCYNCNYPYTNYEHCTD
jgi:hypothetical protein